RNETGPEVQNIEQRWLVVTDSTNKAGSLAHKLTARLSDHIHVSLLSHQAGCNKLETPDEGNHILDLVNGSFAEGFDKLELDKVDSVVFLCGLNTDENDLSNSLNLRTVSALNVVKLLSLSTEKMPALRLVTLGGNTASTERKHLADSALWGLGRVIRNEMAEIDCSQIDLACNNPEALLSELIMELQHPVTNRWSSFSTISRSVT
ncbi:MAG: hypothetical protein RLN85_09490, partial [Pseudomonadales bacterium]